MGLRLRERFQWGDEVVGNVKGGWGVVHEGRWGLGSMGLKNGGSCFRSEFKRL